MIEFAHPLLFDFLLFFFVIIILYILYIVITLLLGIHHIVCVMSKLNTSVLNSKV